MNKKSFSVLSMLIIAVLMAGIPAVYAQTSPGDFTNEPHKTMASAHELFLKGEINKAAEEINKAAAYVKKEADKVAKDAREGVKMAGDDLDKLGQGVKRGTVKSSDELKKTFARVNYELAKAWHKTADEAKKSGKDPINALKEAGAWIEGAARWSVTQLEEGTQTTVEAVKKVGKAAAKGAKAGAEEVEKLFKGIGEGIEDLGRKL
jgi:BMFP domain-containing protein YqiC